mmetsp:Transcript_21374/g.43230  ORF Transcript_21374/g.43230 Transcript_21374/m.43230 type:complete len:252 (-) Transcript_21374:744-1499(-)
MGRRRQLHRQPHPHHPQHHPYRPHHLHLPRRLPSHRPRRRRRRRLRYHPHRALNPLHRHRHGPILHHQLIRHPLRRPLHHRCHHRRRPRRRQARHHQVRHHHFFRLRPPPRRPSRLHRRCHRHHQVFRLCYRRPHRHHLFRHLIRHPYRRPHRRLLPRPHLRQWRQSWTVPASLTTLARGMQTAISVRVKRMKFARAQDRTFRLHCSASPMQSDRSSRALTKGAPANCSQISPLVATMIALMTMTCRTSAR